MTDKDRDGAPEAEEILSTDGLPIRELDDDLDEEAEFEDQETDETPTVGSARRFGFGRGREEQHATGHHDETRHAGSLRESHERVHIDDRASAVFALLCAGILIGVLALAWVGGVLPKAAVPSLAPLVVPTAQAASSAAPSAAVSIAPSASVK
jgi:hypothetical protein